MERLSREQLEEVKNLELLEFDKCWEILTQEGITEKMSEFDDNNHSQTEANKEMIKDLIKNGWSVLKNRVGILKITNMTYDNMSKELYQLLEGKIKFEKR